MKLELLKHVQLSRTQTRFLWTITHWNQDVKVTIHRQQFSEPGLVLIKASCEGGFDYFDGGNVKYLGTVVLQSAVKFIPLHAEYHKLFPNRSCANGLIVTFPNDPNLPAFQEIEPNIPTIQRFQRGPFR